MVIDFEIRLKQWQLTWISNSIDVKPNHLPSWLCHFNWFAVNFHIEWDFPKWHSKAAADMPLLCVFEFICLFGPIHIWCLSMLLLRFSSTLCYVSPAAKQFPSISSIQCIWHSDKGNTEYVWYIHTCTHAQTSHHTTYWLRLIRSKREKPQKRK